MWIVIKPCCIKWVTRYSWNINLIQSTPLEVISSGTYSVLVHLTYGAAYSINKNHCLKFDKKEDAKYVHRLIYAKRSK